MLGSVSAACQRNARTLFSENEKGRKQKRRIPSWYAPFGWCEGASLSMPDRDVNDRPLPSLLALAAPGCPAWKARAPFSCGCANLADCNSIGA